MSILPLLKKPIILPNLGRGTDYVVFLLILLSLTLFGVLGIRPLMLDISFLRLEIRSGRVYEEALERKITDLDEGKAKLAQITTKLEIIDEAVPNEPLQAEFIEEMAMDGGKAGFSLTSTHFKGGETREGVSFESFECVFKGGSLNIIPLLTEIEEGRLIKIKSLKYTQETQSKGRDLLTVSVSGENFYWKGESEK